MKIRDSNENTGPWKINSLLEKISLHCEGFFSLNFQMDVTVEILTDDFSSFQILIISTFEIVFQEWKQMIIDSINY